MEMWLFYLLVLAWVGLGVAQMARDDWGLFTYEDGEWESMIIDLIRRDLATLPPASFKNETLLLQKVEPGKKLAVYVETGGSGGGGGSGREVYKRNISSTESGEAETFIVLQSGEDGLPIQYRKRVWVTLRQNPERNSTYFVNYVYLRLWSDKVENCVESYLNEHICLEWDTWDRDRKNQEQGQKGSFGWEDCSSSFLFSCTNHTHNKSSEPGSAGSPSPPHQGGNVNNTLTSKKYRPPYGTPLDDTIDAFWDLETGREEGQRVRETVKNGLTGGGGPLGDKGTTDTFTIPGWKLQELHKPPPLTLIPNASLRLESHIFYGLGSCHHHKTPSELQLDFGNDPVTLFLYVFRTHCHPQGRDLVEHLLKEKLLEVVHTRKGDSILEYGYFSLSKHNPLWTQRKVGAEEIRRLATALELAAFSQSYVDQIKLEEKGKHWVGLGVDVDVDVGVVTTKRSSPPPPPTISRSVYLLEQFVFKYISLARLVGDEHFVKLCRHLVVTLKGIMTKLLQDEAILLSSCPPGACATELGLNGRDRLGIHSLSQFLLRGLAPVELNSDSDVGNIFRAFVTRNRDPLLESFAFYD